MSRLTLAPEINGQPQLTPITWVFARDDAANLAFTRAVEAINAVYTIPGNAVTSTPERKP
jgi:hypothetical protein